MQRKSPGRLERYQCLVRSGGVSSPNFEARNERKNRVVEKQRRVSRRKIRRFSLAIRAPAVIAAISMLDRGEILPAGILFSKSPRGVGWPPSKKKKKNNKKRFERRERSDSGVYSTKLMESNDRQEVLIHFSRRRTAPTRSRSFNSLINTEPASLSVPFALRQLIASVLTKKRRILNVQRRRVTRGRRGWKIAGERRGWFSWRKKRGAQGEGKEESGGRG